MPNSSSHDTHVCSSCIQEPYLHALIEKNGIVNHCYYCDRDGYCFSLDVISDLTETAIRQHYIRTPTDPSDMEYAMIRHSDYV